MDMLKSYSVTRMRLYSDSDEYVSVRWYPCKPGAPNLGFPHAFASTVWESSNEDTFPPIGEQFGYRYWVKGINPGLNFNTILGTEEEFQKGVSKAKCLAAYNVYQAPRYRCGVATWETAQPTKTKIVVAEVHKLDPKLKGQVGAGGSGKTKTGTKPASGQQQRSKTPVTYAAGLPGRLRTGWSATVYQYGAGTAAGTSSALGVGQAEVLAAGTAAGTSSAIGVGQAETRAAGTAAGTSSASGQAGSIGTAAGTSSASGVGALPPPTGGAAGSATSSTLKITWTAATGSSGANVYQATSSGGPFTKVGSNVASPYTATGLSASTTYYFYLTSVMGGGEGPASSTFSGTTSAATPSVSQSGHGGLSAGTTLTVTWSSAITAGDFLAVALFVDVNTTSVTVPSGWSKAAAEGVALQGQTLICYLPNASARSAGATDAFTFSVSSNVAAAWADVSNVTGTGTVDAHGESLSHATNAPSWATTGATSQASEICLAATGSLAFQTYSSPTNSFSVAEQEQFHGSGVDVSVVLLFKNLTIISTPSVSVTSSTTPTAQLNVIDTFKN